MNNQQFATAEAISALIDDLYEARAINAELVGALEGLINDVAQYEAWQRPCFALDNARAVLAKVKA